MSHEPATYRRRDDGVLQIVGSARRKDEALRGFEIALTVVAVSVAVAAAMTRNIILAGVLFVAASALTTARLIRDRAAARKARAVPAEPGRTREERVVLRVIRLDEHAAPDAQAPGTVRLPGTAASPRE